MKNPMMTETAIKPHCLSGLAIIWSNCSDTPSVSSPSNVPAAVAKKYCSIHPQTTV